MPRRANKASGALSKLQCVQCKQLKTAQEFTPGQLKFAGDAPVTCSDCLNTQKLYRCDGPCGIRKPLEAFSRNGRKGDHWLCRRCTAWDGVQEPEVTPMPQETGVVSPDEMQDFTQDLLPVNSESNAGPFGALNRDFPQNDTLGNHDLHSRSNFSSHASVASTASTVAPASRLTSHAAVSYNAYDARARRHRATHTPTEATSAEDTSTSGWVTTTTVNDPNVVGDWTGLTDDGEAAASSRVRWHQPTAEDRAVARQQTLAFMPPPMACNDRPQPEPSSDSDDECLM